MGRKAFKQPFACLIKQQIFKHSPPLGIFLSHQHLNSWQSNGSRAHIKEKPLWETIGGRLLSANKGPCEPTRGSGSRWGGGEGPWQPWPGEAWLSCSPDLPSALGTLPHVLMLIPPLQHCGHLPTAMSGLAGSQGESQSLVSQSLPMTGSRGLWKAQQQNKNQVVPLLHTEEASGNCQLRNSWLNGPDTWYFWWLSLRPFFLCSPLLYLDQLPPESHRNSKEGGIKMLVAILSFGPLTPFLLFARVTWKWEKIIERSNN